jgi:uncharacterized protein YjbJ (UPF0337 family)
VAKEATTGEQPAQRKGEIVGLLGGRSGKEDKDEGAMDRAKGRIKEAGGALTGDKKLKREGRSDQRRGRAKQKKGDLKDLLS